MEPLFYTQVTMTIETKRAYDTPSEEDGFRILVDKFWPRGVKKEACPYDLWAKEIAPTDELRKRFHQDQDKMYQSFSQAYQKELEESAAFDAVVEQLQELKPKKVTLLYGSKNREHNHARVLQQMLAKRLKE